MLQSTALIHCIHIYRKDCKHGETVPFVVAISSSEKSNKPKRIHSRCWALECGGIKRITGLKNNSSYCLCSPDGSRWRPSQDNYLMHQHQLSASQQYNTRGNIFLSGMLEHSLCSTDLLQVGICLCLGLEHHQRRSQ